MQTSGVGREELKVVAVSSVASVFEWFDFLLYGSLAVILGRHFFSGVDESTGFILALLAFAAGFVVRPFGAVLFGSLGDRLGRKKVLQAALALMGVATFAVGLLPTYAQIGAAAPWILVFLRMAQGLSVGGVYGGAATYVAEHVPQRRRGFYTSWIQITASFAMALCLLVVLGTRWIMGEAAFVEWGWRLPFLSSSVLLGITLWIQGRLAESPVYLRMKAAGRTSASPWRDALGSWSNLKWILTALFGVMIGQAVIWYTSVFYVLYFLERVLKVEGPLANLVVAAGVLLSSPLYVFFGWLSDHIGRKPVILGACLLALLSYHPLFKALTSAANPALAQAVATAPVSVYADRSECTFQFDPLGRAAFSTSCDIARSFLTRAGVTYDTVGAPRGTLAELRVGTQVMGSFRGDLLPPAELRERRAAWEREAGALIGAAGYPAGADAARVNMPLTILLVWLIMLAGAMVYGPVAAVLVELFPANVRYTGMSVSYHLGTGWFGGFLPTIAFAVVAATGNIYSGLWYPLIGAAITLVAGAILLPETRHADIHRHSAHTGAGT